MRTRDIWSKCLRMWKWIAEQVELAIAEGRSWDIDDLKAIWTRENNEGDMVANCFFCAAAKGDCYDSCPGKKVSPRFNCCNETYHYRYRPIKFYAKLLRMDKKRKQQ